MLADVPEIEAVELSPDDIHDCIDLVSDCMGLEDGVMHGPLGGSASFYKSLVLGVVAKAMSDYVRYKTSNNRRLRYEARTAEVWLFSDPPNPVEDTVLGSFAWVCAVLDLDPEPARMRFRQMSPQDLPKTDRGKDR